MLRASAPQGPRRASLKDKEGMCKVAVDLSMVVVCCVIALVNLTLNALKCTFIMLRIAYGHPMRPTATSNADMNMVSLGASLRCFQVECRWRDSSTATHVSVPINGPGQFEAF